MSPWRRAWLAGLVSFGLGACASPPPEPAAVPMAADAALTLRVLHVNDHHSHLESRDAVLRLRNATGQRVPVTVSLGGFPRLTAAFAELSNGPDPVLKLHAGDALVGTLYVNRAGARGEADAALMNTVCFDAFTLGNHEFDQGDTALADWLARLASGPCQTPVLSANVRFGPLSALATAAADGRVRAAVVRQPGGVPVGVVGLTIAAKTMTSSHPDPSTVLEDEAAAAQQAIDGLRRAGVTRILLLSHVGLPMDLHLATALSGVDVVIGGDSHTLLGPAALAEYGVGSPVGPYGQMLRNRDGEAVCVAQAWEYGQVLGELRVRFDAAGRVLDCGGTPHVLIGDDFRVAGVPADPADHQAFLDDIAVSGFLRLTAPDPQATAVLQPYRARLQAFRQAVVAEAPEELCARRVPGGPGSVDYSRSSVRCNAEGRVAERGGDMQQLVAHAYRTMARTEYGGVDISLQSGGGVRRGLQGRVTAADVIEVLPFDNTLWTLSLSGAEVRAMIEDGLEAVFGPGGSTGPYPYAAGLRWQVDASRPVGARARNLEVLQPESGRWVPLDEARQYRLIVPSFLAAGGDGYHTLARVPPDRRRDTGAHDLDVLLRYLGTLTPGADGLPRVERLPPGLYSTQSFVPPRAP